MVFIVAMWRNFIEFLIQPYLVCLFITIHKQITIVVHNNRHGNGKLLLS